MFVRTHLSYKTCHLEVRPIDVSMFHKQGLKYGGVGMKSTPESSCTEREERPHAMQPCRARVPQNEGEEEEEEGEGGDGEWRPPPASDES